MERWSKQFCMGTAKQLLIVKNLLVYQYQTYLRSRRSKDKFVIDFLLNNFMMLSLQLSIGYNNYEV